MIWVGFTILIAGLLISSAIEDLADAVREKGAGMTDKELMQQALDALEKIEMGGDPRWANDVTPALRARLAQPETYPENFIDALRFETALAQPDYVDRRQWNYDPMTGEPLIDGWPLYSGLPKREWVGLTNNEVNNFAAGCHLGKSVQGAIYEAEAKLKEKNT